MRTTMNLYLISQDKDNDYDTYDSAVVAAKSEEEARLIHPDKKEDWDGKDDDGIYSTWVKSSDVTVKLIGAAAKGIKKGVICASFNAG